MIALIILLATIENMAPLIIGWSRTPPGYAFLGTVHHPADYFYYLSQFSQGVSRTITTVDLYTTEQIRSSFVGWSNVLAGKAFGFFGVPPLIAYHLSVAVLTVLLLIACYRLALSILGSRRGATIALYLFSVFHAFPILRDGKPSYGDYWNNFAVPLVRMGSVPHQLLMAFSSILVLYFFSKWTHGATNRRKNTLIGITLASFILAGLQPALWALILVSFGLTAIVYILLYRRNIKLLNNFIIPIIYAGIGGLLPALYLYQRFLTPPFLQLKLWEATQQTQLTWYHFLSATGPVFILGLISVPWMLRDRSPVKLLLVVFSCLSYILFLSPIPQALGISHVRFMSTLTILCVSIIAANGIEKLSTGVGRSKIFERSGFPSLISKILEVSKARSKNTTYTASKNQRAADLENFATTSAPQVVYFLILVALTLYLLPNHLTTIRLASNFTANNAYQYVATGDYQLLRTAGKISNPSDTFLIIWPYNVVFPGLTGRKTYTGHPLLTINAGQKEETANRFFNNELTPAQTHDLLTTHHITHVITYSWTALPHDLYDILATDGSLSLYRINQGYLKSYSK